MDLTFVSAVNDPAVLKACLLASPDLATGAEVVIQRDFASAALAYNQALDCVTGEVIVFVHQDVYLPLGWIDTLRSSLDALEKKDPQWGVLGLCGMTAGGELRAWVYSSGLGRTLGGPFEGPAPVRTLDEVLLVVRRSSGLRFDDRLPGFHMYATDLCLSAEKAGRQNYVIPCFAIHNSNGIRLLPDAFWQACTFVRRKWKDRLPVISPCTRVTRWPVRHLLQRFGRFVQFSLRRKPIGRRVANPAALHESLIPAGRARSMGPTFHDS